MTSPCLTHARLPKRYQNAFDIESQITADYRMGKLDLDTINLWVHQALMKDLLDTLPDYPTEDESNYPEETRLHHIRWMLNTAWHKDMAPDKAARWLAFVQGVSAVHGWIDIGVERDRTRPLLHLCARVAGKDTPESIGRDATSQG